MPDTVVGVDFGAPAAAGDQAKKVIAVEAKRVGPRRYVITAEGLNERLVRAANAREWASRRRGWTIPDLANALGAPCDVPSVAAFDFPFSVPSELLGDEDFAARLGQSAFNTRAAFAAFVSGRLPLRFEGPSASAKMAGLSSFGPWRAKEYWLRRHTDRIADGQPPLKDKFQNLFAMTLAGTAMLHALSQRGVNVVLGPQAYVPGQRFAVEAYPGAVADAIHFGGSYKADPAGCLEHALRELRTKLDLEVTFDPAVRAFCETYRSSANDPDGADAFLCVVTAMCFREGLVQRCCREPEPQLTSEEGCIIIPDLHAGRELHSAATNRTGDPE